MHYTAKFKNYLFKEQDLPDNSVGKESACNAGDSSLIPGLGRSAGDGIGYSLQYSWIHLQCRRPWFYPWVGKVPWRRLPTPVFWPGEFHGVPIISIPVRYS